MQTYPVFVQGQDNKSVCTMCKHQTMRKCIRYMRTFRSVSEKEESPTGKGCTVQVICFINSPEMSQNKKVREAIMQRAEQDVKSEVKQS